ncbi:Lysophospholipase, alpha-beta hydrolase superfamily [Thermosyntropha lipolytica DSM 11003]|uniref:Lysophospholipase, alpha-beta hydrolase superfamily n=1 Tax=Thermosyntropha lipolytica DSM 11003 TaxID=1123382 RepID=A0A1M5LVA3_9FIRM|nr:alpha/beta hydrolase [Thermosyntropha lipolytica]SHG69062.1 Lysophospholipase, alpha-beta hydrolase superfamily [Thermosyntropha lipolytica DSM 11003]
MDSFYEGFYIEGAQGEKIYLHSWAKVSSPRGVVQIFHGMAEHGKRYERLARYLNEQGLVVFADDHRGHGRTAGSLENLGYIGEDGFNLIVEDEYKISCWLREKYPGVPLFIIAHSFGSFIAQEYIIRYGKEIEGVILCGSAAMDTIKAKAGYIVASLVKMIKGEKHKSPFLDYLSFGSFNRKIKDSRSKFAWLSTDDEEVKKYEEDPFCGTLFTAGFFYYLARAFLHLYKQERLNNIPADLPILIIAGSDDPVGEYGKLVQKLYYMYKNIGCNDVDIKLYPGKRHELFNEKGREEIYKDVNAWLQKKINRY